MNLSDVLLKPLITEKSEAQRASGKFTFKVHPAANKELVSRAVAELFKVEVVKVNILNVRGKRRNFRNQHVMLPDWKKAIVTLKAGQTLDFYEVG